MKSDLQLRTDIDEALADDPAINPAHIGVAVDKGIVTLSGQLDTFAQKHAVERAARRVAGVRGIALDLEVELAPAHVRSDTDIAQTALAALRMNSLVPDGKVKVEVENGWVTLSGQVDWGYQLASAEQCIRPLVGVRGLSNQVTVKPRVQGKDLAARITAALTRQAERDARHIGIEVDGAVVTLSGKVHSMAERDAAVGVAFSARGVARVVDHLEVAA